MEVTTDLTIGSTRVLIAPLPAATQGQKRADREREATAALLSYALGHPAAITHAPNGAPRLAGADSSWHISVSHSRTRVAVALNPVRRIGIDVEEWRDQLVNVKNKFVQSGEEAEWGSRLLEAWMAKEAAYKAFEPVDSITVLSIRIAGSTASYGNSLARLHFGEGFVLAEDYSLMP